MAKIELKPDKYLVIAMATNRNCFNIVRGFSSKRDALKEYKKVKEYAKLIYLVEIEKTAIDGVDYKPKYTFTATY